MLGDLDLANNPVTQVLGQEYDAQWLRETFLFFYCCHVMSEVLSKRTANTVHLYFLSMLRAFGSYGFFLPMVLGRLPSRAWQSADTFSFIMLIAYFFCNYLRRYIPDGPLTQVIEYLNKFAYSVIKGNAVGHGFAMTVAALPEGGFVAPFIGGFFAVNGHRFLEHGLGFLSKSRFDDDMLLGLVGPVWYFAMTTQFEAAPIVARATMIAVHFSCNWIDYNNIFDQVKESLGGRFAGGAAPAKSGMKKRGRSSTPGSKK